MVLPHYETICMETFTVNNIILKYEKFENKFKIFPN